MHTGPSRLATTSQNDDLVAPPTWPVVGRLPVDEQLDSLSTALSSNETLTEVLSRAPSLQLPHWYLTAGCLFQTIWNVVTGRAPTHGIKDYDLFYFDDSDLSWEAEDSVIRAAENVFAGVAAEVEVRNQARVHLWYRQKFGFDCPVYTSTEEAIGCFGATTCCLGIRLLPDGRTRVYAPHGLADVFNLVLRPNPVLFTRELYEAKARRWRATWPELTVLDWPEPSA